MSTKKKAQWWMDVFIPGIACARTSEQESMPPLTASATKNLNDYSQKLVHQRTPRVEQACH
jgi:hypothetical protein